MTIDIKNAIVKRTTLGFEDHGIFTAYLELDYGDSGQSFGGYSIGADFIKEVLKTLEVDNWEDVRGQKIRVKAESFQIHAIGHFLKDKWFNPKEFYERKKREDRDE